MPDFFHKRSIDEASVFLKRLFDLLGSQPWEKPEKVETTSDFGSPPFTDNPLPACSMARPVFDTSSDISR